MNSGDPYGTSRDERHQRGLAALRRFGDDAAGPILANSDIAPDLVPNDEGYAAALQNQVERTRRASVTAAAAAATAALSAAADSAASGPAPVPYARRAPPASVSLPEPMTFKDATPVEERGGIVISRPVSQPMSVRDRMLPDGAAEFDQADLRLPLAGDVLTHCAPRAGTVPELHALLVAQAGTTIDKKRLAKQLRAVAKMPL